MLNEEIGVERFWIPLLCLLLLLLLVMVGLSHLLLLVMMLLLLLLHRHRMVLGLMLRMKWLMIALLVLRSWRISFVAVVVKMSILMVVSYGSDSGAGGIISLIGVIDR